MTYEILIALLTFVSVIAIGASVLIARREKRAKLTVRLQDSREVGLQEQQADKQPDLLKFAAQLGNLVSHGHSRKSLNEQLLRAGYVDAAGPAIYIGIKMLLFTIGIAVLAILIIPIQLSAAVKISVVVLGASVLSFIPNLVVMLQLKKRHDEIQQHLPEAVDLLEICVSSGMGLDMAWNVVSEEIQDVSPDLSSAMSLTNFEVNLGASRTEAMRHMSDRTGVGELSSLASILIQTERFGTSIAETLRIFAASMREERSFSAEETAEKMAVKVLFPMVLFIFPAVLIVVAGPAMVTIFRVMGK